MRKSMLARNDPATHLETKMTADMAKVAKRPAPGFNAPP